MQRLLNKTKRCCGFFVLSILMAKSTCEHIAEMKTPADVNPIPVAEILHQLGWTWTIIFPLFIGFEHISTIPTCA